MRDYHKHVALLARFQNRSCCVFKYIGHRGINNSAAGIGGRGHANEPDLEFLLSSVDSRTRDLFDHIRSGRYGLRSENAVRRNQVLDHRQRLNSLTEAITRKQFLRVAQVVAAKVDHVGRKPAKRARRLLVSQIRHRIAPGAEEEEPAFNMDHWRLFELLLECLDIAVAPRQAATGIVAVA